MTESPAAVGKARPFVLTRSKMPVGLIPVEHNTEPTIIDSVTVGGP